MEDTKKQELLDDMLRKFDELNEARDADKNRLFEDFCDLAHQYASYTGCSYKHALNILFLKAEER